MRSAASHFSSIIRFVIFMIVVGALIYAVVHWAKQRQNHPTATKPATVQTADNKSETKEKPPESSSSKNNTTEKTPTSDKQSSQSDTAKPKDTANKPTKIAGDTTTPKPSTTHNQSEQVPNTGVGLTQAVIGTIGLSLSMFLIINYSQSRNWRAKLKNS